MTNPEKKNPGWKEKPQTIITRKGVQEKAPRHYEVSVKKDLVDVLRQPLVMVDNTAPVIKEKPIVAKNPVEQFIERRYVYQGAYTIIRETLQNSERISRDRKVPVDITITFNDDSYTIEDNAGGVNKNNIDTVFNLGVSGYEHLGEETQPFGEGFISFILLFGKVEVISNDIDAEFDFAWIEEQYKKDPKFDMMKAYKVAEYSSDETLGAKQKFIAKFTKPLPSYNKEKAIKIAKEIAKTMPVRSITINGELANNKINFNETPYGYVRVEKKYGEKEGIIGYFTAGGEYDYIKLFDHGAPVGSISKEVVDNRYGNLPAMMGNINIMHTFYGQANKSRDGWITDDRIERTEKFIKELARDYAIELIDILSDSQIEKVQHFISRYTTFNDIKYHIRFEVIEPEIVELVTKVERDLHKDLSEENFKLHMSEILKSPSKLNEAVSRAKDYSPKIDAAAYNEKQKQLEQEHAKLQQEKAEQQPDPERSSKPTPEQQGVQEKQDVINEKQQDLKEEKEATEKKQKTVVEKVNEFLEARSGGGMTFAKWKKETFWCDRKDVEQYADTLKMAGYYRINIAIAENKFQKMGFEAFDNFVHISELESSMHLIPKISSPGAQNAKERRIEFIMRAFLDAAGYNNVKTVIANITGRRVIRIQKTDKKIDEEFGLVAYAEPSTNSIYLQRKIGFGTADGTTDYTGVKALYPFLEYNDFPLESKSIGMGDIAVFSKIRKTLSHELAHLVYKTKDDTADHYKAIVIVDSKFDSVIAEFKASSRISDSLDGLNKKARDRIGVQKGDKTVITVTKGTEGQVEKQEVPALRKMTLSDIYRQAISRELITYKEMIEKYDDIEDLQRAINAGTYTFTGYKIGDLVLYNDSYFNEEKKGTIKKTGHFGSTSIEIQRADGFTIIYVPLEKIIRKLDKVKPKYLKGEIFVDDNNLAKTYAQILEYYNAGDFPIESGKFKPTGFKIGDRIIFRREGNDGVRKGIIKSASGYITAREDDEITPKERHYDVYLDIGDFTKEEAPSRQLSFEDLLKEN
ncbi:MAG: hypothetical protein PHW62_00595 [Candidatus Ratteibacteria bacterium]|nr:hypothetical protein [Candidatus Ratteibacteria bacterium]